jgi:hypothetical protein
VLVVEREVRFKDRVRSLKLCVGVGTKRAEVFSLELASQVRYCCHLAAFKPGSIRFDG